MSGNICRCGAYSNIMDAITEVAGAPRVGGKSMRAFTYERARTPAEAAAAALRQPNTRFIAGGTNLLDLMKLEIETPAHLVDVNGLGWTRSSRRRMAACASARWCAIPTWRPTCACGATMPCCRAPCWPAPRPAAQQGDHRRQPAAAHPLPLLLRHQPAVQQARAGQRLRGDRRLHTAATPSSAQRGLHRDPSERHGGGDAAARCARRDGAPTAPPRTIPIADFHRLPGNTPHIEHTCCCRAS
jgi:xanthine dehydrogenase YagS FAD-binding subunit